MKKEFIFEGRGKAQRTRHEEIARRNIYYAFQWIVGGYYNALQDGNTDYLPKSRKALADEIYDSAMTDLCCPGMVQYGNAPREMRFAGEKFCRAYIEWKLDNDSDTAEIAEEAGWNKL